jgi:hypothetical protein
MQLGFKSMTTVSEELKSLDCKDILINLPYTQRNVTLLSISVLKFVLEA